MLRRPTRGHRITNGTLYKKLEPLSAASHGDLRLRAIEDYRFAADVSQVPLVGDEIAEAAKYFPVVFTAGDTPRPTALLGLSRGQNAFVDAGGRWMAGYVPAWLRRYPFTFARPDPTRDAVYDVMIDRQAVHLSTDVGEPLFATGESDGRRSTPVLDRAVAFLSTYREADAAMPARVAPLRETGVLVARDLNVRENGQQTRRIGGMRLVDRDRVTALCDRTLAAWARSGLLEIVHLHWQSLTNFRRLAGDIDA